MRCSYSRCNNPLCGFTARQLTRTGLGLGQPVASQCFPTDLQAGAQLQLTPHEPDELWRRAQPIATWLASHRSHVFAEVDLTEHAERRRTPLLAVRLLPAPLATATSAEVAALEQACGTALVSKTHARQLARRRNLARVPSGCKALRRAVWREGFEWQGGLQPERGCPDCDGNCARAVWRAALLPAAARVLAETRDLLCAAERGDTCARLVISARRWGTGPDELTFDLLAELR